jgi:hypothetical protein
MVATGGKRNIPSEPRMNSNLQLSPMPPKLPTLDAVFNFFENLFKNTPVFSK